MKKRLFLLALATLLGVSAPVGMRAFPVKAANADGVVKEILIDKWGANNYGEPYDTYYLYDTVDGTSTSEDYNYEFCFTLPESSKFQNGVVYTLDEMVAISAGTGNNCYYDYTHGGMSVNPYTSASFIKTVDESDKVTIIVDFVDKEDNSFHLVYSEAPLIDVTSVNVDLPTTSILVGQTIQPVLTIEPENASFKGVTWTSNNPSVASVTGSGLVTGLKPGTATITATANHGTPNANISFFVTVTGEEIGDAIIITDPNFELPAQTELESGGKCFTFSSPNDNLYALEISGNFPATLKAKPNGVINSVAFHIVGSGGNGYAPHFRVSDGIRTVYPTHYEDKDDGYAYFDRFAGNEITIDADETYQRLRIDQIDVTLVFNPKADLETAISNAQTLLDSMANNNAYSSVRGSLRIALESAQRVYRDGDASQAEIDTATQNLNEAIATARDGKKVVDDQLAANAVMDLIDSLPAEVAFTEEYKTKLDEAKAAYDALTAEQKQLVTNYTDLTDKQASYDRIGAVVSLINAIGTVAYDEESKQKIDDAKEAYLALSDAEKGQVTNLTTLQSAEATYQDFYDQEKADEVDALIDAIGELAFDDASKERIDAARSAYEALSEGQKAKVAKLSALNQAEIEYVQLAITAIGEVTGDAACKAKIDAARALYDALRDDQKSAFPAASLTQLQNAETTYQDRYDQGKADEVDALIDAIGELKFDDASKERIDAARSAYEALSEAQKAKVAKLSALDHADIEYVQLAIASIGEVTGDAACKAKIDAARALYDALRDDQKSAFPAASLTKLENAEYAYTVFSATSAINDIPDLSELTLEDKAKVEAALAAYNALSDADKAKFPQEQLNKLLAAQSALRVLEVSATIDSLPSTKKISASDQAAIDAAKSAYDALSPEEQAKVSPETKQKLEDALNAIVAVYVADEISSLPNAEAVTTNDEDAIKAARAAYEELTPEQQSLLSAETLAKLVAAEDGLAAARVKELINGLGEIDYNDASKEKIDEARAAYEALTPEQKALIGDRLNALITAENTYAAKEAEAKAGVPGGLTAGIVISAIVLTAGIGLLIYLIMKLRKKDDEGVVKAKSSALFVPLFAVLSAATTGATIALIILLVLALGVIAADVVLFLKLRKKNEKARAAKEAEPLPLRVEEKAEPAQEAVAIDGNEEDDGQEIETVTDERGNVFQIRYVRSFTAKLIQAPEETKKYYEELKNEVLSYKKANSRVSWHFDSVNSGRAQVLKFAIRGKTLCVYLALDADDYNDTKYKVEKAESKKFEDVPCLYRIKNDRRLGYAKDLIAVIMGRLGVEKGEEKHESYADLPYEPNKPLIERGLIKELKVAVSKPQEAVAVAENDEEDGGEVETVTDERGNVFQIRYVRSFTAKLIQAPKETKQYYEELKNEVLSYKKANSRISWHYDAINVGREKAIKFAIRGKTLCVYFALNAEDYAETKYKVEAVESKKFEETPCLYRIKNDRRLGYAKDLIAVIMGRLGVEKGEEKHEPYADLPYEPNRPLIERGLIKELKVAVNKPQEAVVEKKTNADGDEVILTKDGAGNLFEIRFVKSFTAKLSQSEDVVKNYYSILKNYALSYKNVHTRVSWHFDSLNLGRAQILKFAVRGKTLCVYFALNAEDYADTKYKVEKVESKKFEDVPCLYRIKNDRRLGYAKDLIDALMAKFAAVKGKESNEDFTIPYETTEALLEKGLVKELKTRVNAKEEEPLRSVEASTVDRLMSDEKAESSIEEDVLHSRREGKKDIINIDTLSENFNDGDTVDLDALLEKKLVPANTGYVKVLARGILDKKLIVDLDDFSLQAVKMIVLMGGRAKKVK